MKSSCECKTSQMADSTYIGPPQAEVDQLIRIAQTPAISKPILQNICVINGLLKSGNKIDLQRRIIKRE